MKIDHLLATGRHGRPASVRAAPGLRNVIDNLNVAELADHE